MNTKKTIKSFTRSPNPFDGETFTSPLTPIAVTFDGCGEWLVLDADESVIGITNTLNDALQIAALQIAAQNA